MHTSHEVSCEKLHVILVMVGFNLIMHFWMDVELGNEKLTHIHVPTRSKNYICAQHSKVLPLLYNSHRVEDDAQTQSPVPVTDRYMNIMLFPFSAYFSICIYYAVWMTSAGPQNLNQ